MIKSFYFEFIVFHFILPCVLSMNFYKKKLDANREGEEKKEETHAQIGVDLC